MQTDLPLQGGFDLGPLFAPDSFKRTQCKPRKRASGGKIIWAKYKRAKPPWTTWAECAAFWDQSAAMTAATGIQHSVDHIVPLRHPLVCGLHCPANLRVIPMAENARKSNRHWPDMPEFQEELPNLVTCHSSLSPVSP